MIIETIVLDYLTHNLSVPAVTEIPSGDFTECVAFHVTDRDKQNHLEMATLEFECFAESKYNAAVLDEELRRVMEEIIELNEISASKFGGGNDDFDTTLKRYRYRSFFNLYYK